MRRCLGTKKTERSEPEIREPPQKRIRAKGSADIFSIDWNSEIGLATREHKATKKLEVSLPLENPMDRPLDCEMVAEWHDGMKASVPGLTKSRYDEFHKAKAARSSSFLFGTASSDTYHTITVLHKAARPWLIAITEQGKQILQCRMDYFGPVANQKELLPKDDPTLETATQVFAKIAKRYASGMIRKCELYEARDEIIKPYKEKSRASKGDDKLSKESCGSAAEAAVHDEDDNDDDDEDADTHGDQADDESHVNKRPAAATTVVEHPSDDESEIDGEELGEELVDVQPTTLRYTPIAPPPMGMANSWSAFS